MKSLLQELHKIVDGLLYLSESEYPVNPFIIEVADESEIAVFLASRTNTEEKFVQKITARNFFARFKNYLAYGGPDEIMNENARQFIKLQHFLKENFETTQVFRIEKPGDAVIPIYIICKLKDGKGFTGLATTAIET